MTHSDLDGPDAVVSKDLVLCEGDFEGSKGHTPTFRPVLLALLLAPLLEVGHHDDGGGPLLPDQPPESQLSICSLGPTQNMFMHVHYMLNFVALSICYNVIVGLPCVAINLVRF